MFGWSPGPPHPPSPTTTNRDISFGILMEDKDSELYYHTTGVGGFPERTGCALEFPALQEGPSEYE